MREALRHMMKQSDKWLHRTLIAVWLAAGREDYLEKYGWVPGHPDREWVENELDAARKGYPDG